MTGHEHLITNLDEYFRFAKDADGLRATASLWPKGEKRKDAESKIDAAEKSLRLTEAELTKKLGYHLCQCKFPPSVMLWRENEKAHVCPNCGRQIGDPGEPLPPMESEYF